MATLNKMRPGSKVRLLTFDWSGVISDDRPPVYEANMRMLEMYGKQRMSFEQWLPQTTMTPIEFMANQGVNGNPDSVFGLYRKALHQNQGRGDPSESVRGCEAIAA